MLFIVVAILASLAILFRRTHLSIEKLRAYALSVATRLNLLSDQVKLTPEQSKLFTLYESNSQNMFITGKAGTGKSVLLQHIKRFSAKRVVLLAPTGLAALNIGGQTINSLFKLPLKYLSVENLRLDPKVAPVLANIDAIIIDEASMVRADMLDAIDYLLRQARKNQTPFGGAQILLFGDVYQLPPVVTGTDLKNYFSGRNGGFYFFNAHVWPKADFTIHELTRIFRQKDQEFIALLNAVRTGNITNTILDELNTRANKKIPSNDILTLATTNRVVSGINSQRLQALKSKEYTFNASIIGQMDAQPTESTLRLKKGAQIMLIRNDKDKRWANGSIGQIYSCDKNKVLVEIRGRIFTIRPETWQTIEYAYDSRSGTIIERSTCSFTQLPIKLAWAVTIHKAQGQTLEDVVIDFAQGTFAHGQAYVALSRCISLGRMYLSRPILASDIIVDDRVSEFMNGAVPTNK